MHRHLPLVRVNVVLQVVQAPVVAAHAVQFAGQGLQTLSPGLYVPAVHVIGVTQTPPEKALVELQPHFPAEGVLVVNEVLHPVQYPVLLQVVQFAGQEPHVLLPRLYWPVGQTVNVEVHAPLTRACPAGHAHAPATIVNVGAQVVHTEALLQVTQLGEHAKQLFYPSLNSPTLQVAALVQTPLINN